MAEKTYLKESYRPRRRTSSLCLAGFLTSLFFIFMAAASGLGTRWDLWGFRTGFLILRISVYGAIISGLLSFLGAVVCTVKMASLRGIGVATAGLLISLGVIMVPLMWYLEAQDLPRIHDISTDTENPPRFSSFLPLRPTPPEYAGDEVAEIQKKHYPDIRPLELAVPPDAAFDAALKSAKALGWTIIDESRPNLHIEAVDTTFWFGFKDDIVVRITPEGTGSRVDVRSVSRVGVSDIGTNAERIRRYFALIRKNP